MINPIYEEEDSIMKKNIYLVTGAAGFLGSNICRL